MSSEPTCLGWLRCSVLRAGSAHWPWRLANCSVRLTTALLVSCGDSSPPPFELLRVEPAVVSTSVATPAIVEGAEFYDLAKVSLNRNEPATIERGWNVWVDTVHLRSDQTERIDASSLSVVLPAGLPLGIHDLSVTDPRGQSRTLFHALTVVADDNTTIPNAGGGASSNGSGGTTAGSNGAGTSSTLWSSGGTAAIGGIGSTAGSSNTLWSSGGTAAIGGIGSTAGSSSTLWSSGGTAAIGGIGSTAGSSSTLWSSGGTAAIGGIGSTAGSSNTLWSSGGTAAIGGIGSTAGSSNTSLPSGGTEAAAGNTSDAGNSSASSTNPPACPNGTCDPGESPCSCPADCQPPSCADAGFPQLCDASDPSLVACYRFESSAQPGKDDSQYGNNATSKNVSLVSGHDGNSISLGANSQVNVAKSQSLDVPYITIETWVYVTKTPSGTRAGLLDSEGQYGLFLLKSGALWCSVTTTSGGSAAQTTAVVHLIEWTHVACTGDGVNVKIFINGVEQASAPSKDLISASGTTGASIGADNPSGDNLVGLLDDLRIWNVAHTSEQVCRAALACTP